ncbi:glycosyltransferase [Demequina muriae]|uniref:Glycosyltransferase n=1 Tax=Demequina muriae TaxID=3051664 RepID=A0ABT8GKH0_9MICO|nr:glycosyltransferase [Demequina sp. EGI L300058]MDN4481744.1 glycosyltransferase [Demequina sp. EGI L300058]
MDPRESPVALSVVIPCFDSAQSLPRQLGALAAQEWDGAWEVVIADNGSTDATADVARSWSDRLPALTVVDASARRGAAHARNVGARHARFAHVVWIDADDAVQPGFLAAMADALAQDEFCCGSWDAPHEDASLEALPDSAGRGWRAVIADRGFLDAVGACNGIGVSRDAFDAGGGFPEDMTWGSEDTAFCWSMQLAGHPMVRVAGARVAVHPRVTAREIWRQQVNWGIGAVDAYRRFRDRGAPRSSTVGALVRWCVLILAAPAAALVPRWRYRWMGTVARRWGRLRGSIRFRTLYL